MPAWPTSSPPASSSPASIRGRSSDKDPDIAPDLVPLRERLMVMVGRPVNIQASRDIVTRFRGDLLGQPYVTLFAKPEGLSLKDFGEPA